MGHIAHLRKQFKSINTYDYVIMLIKRRKKNIKKLHENLLVLHLKKLESPSPKEALCQVQLKLAQWFWRRRFFNFLNVFSLFRNYIPLEKGGALHLNKLQSPLSKDALCQVWLKLAQWFQRRRFLNFVNVFLVAARLGTNPFRHLSVRLGTNSFRHQPVQAPKMERLGTMFFYKYQL